MKGETIAGSNDSEESSQDAKISVQLSSDRMTAMVTDYTAPQGEGMPLDIEAIKDQIVAAGVTIDLDQGALQSVLNRIAGKKNVSGIVVARGVLPTPGEDGILEMRFGTIPTVGSFGDDGKVDFHERSYVQSVSSGACLGYLIAGAEGIPGVDVTGQPVLAPKGRPANVKAGENVQLSDDGFSLVATANGMVNLVNNVLSVTQTLEIPGDVNFSTGNLSMNDGSLHIKGTVHSGFKVQASAHIIVEQSIEEAEVHAGGDVEVKQGILKGSVFANGNVIARFAENARIEVGGDIVVAGGLFNCEVIAKGRVVAIDGKGLIRGGTITAGTGVEANEIGSALIASTHVIIGMEDEQYVALIQEKAHLVEHLANFRQKYGDIDLESLGEAPTSLVMAKAMRSGKRLKRLELLIASALERMRRVGGKTLLIRKTLHPGTWITITGVTTQLTHPVVNSWIYCDGESNEIRWCPS